MWTGLHFFLGLNFFLSPLPFLVVGSVIFPLKEVDGLLPIPGLFLKGFPVALLLSACLVPLKFAGCGPLCLAPPCPCWPLGPFLAEPLFSCSFFTFSFFTERFTLIFLSTSWEPFSFSANITASVLCKEMTYSAWNPISKVTE